MDDFFWRALAAASGIAIVAGPLGCFIVWRRMAYFGDSLAHSALLGVALGLVMGIEPALGILLTCVLAALALVLLQRQRELASDTLLGIISHCSLATGLVALSFFETSRVDLLGYLFGDILAVSASDLVWIAAAGILVLAVLAWLWQPLLLATLHEDLARAEGHPVFALRLVHVVLIAIVTAMAMKVVGVLLITSLLIIPAAGARQVSRSPEQMALMSILWGLAACAAGLSGSLTWDTPSGPSIVVAAMLIFGASLVAGRILRRS